MATSLVKRRESRQLRRTSRGIIRQLLIITASLAGICVLLSAAGFMRADMDAALVEDLPFPPMTPDETGAVPPLALVEDVSAVTHFVRASVDDVVEDAVKLLCVGSAYAVGAGMAYGTSSSVLRTAFGLPLAVASFLPCDDLADYVGDKAEQRTNTLLEALFGIPPLEPELKAPRKRHAVLRLVDDVTEDGFKAACLWSHFLVGDLLKKNLQTSRSARLLGNVLALGVPASKYNLCNVYADFLGDWTQYYVGVLTKAGPVALSRNGGNDLS